MPNIFTSKITTALYIGQQHRKKDDFENKDMPSNHSVKKKNPKKAWKTKSMCKIFEKNCSFHVN